VQQFNLGIQKKLGRHLLEVGYLGNSAKRLPMAGAANALNEVRPELRGPGDAQSRRPFPQFGNVSPYGENRYSSLYHGGFISLRRHFANGLSFQTNYTLARHLDNQMPRSYYDLKNNYGPATLERRHRLVWSSMYELPLGAGKPLVNSGALSKVFGGWSLATLLELRSGGPFRIDSVVNTCNCFSQGNQGVDLIGKPKIDHSNFDPATQTWFNTAAFAFPRAYTFGNAGKGILEAPGLAILDTTVVKRTQISERFALEIRGEFFNALNRANFNGPNASLGSPAFGRITGAQEPRRTQLGAKLYF
jgi:hypothetical protein